jgi:hypothetical protein
MTRRFEGRREAGWRGVACVVVLSAWCTACGLFPIWNSKPPEPVVVTPIPIKPSVQVSAAPAFRLIVPTTYGASVARLFVVNTLVKNVGDAPLDFRPEKARLLMPDGSPAGMVFDVPRAAEVLRRTRLASLSAPIGSIGSDMPDYERSQRTREVSGLLLYGTTLLPGQEAHGYLIADAGTGITTFEGLALEVAVTRASDQSIMRDLYRFVSPSAATSTGGG